ncbi:MAG: hypothetical protein JWL77_106 [Chthonomonadaceae bacterium]|nr:hypothetical protein [Chthonomonadaceae bacterium]
MTKRIGAVLALVLMFGLSGLVRADDTRAGKPLDKDVEAVLDKAIKALGGEEPLGKIKAASWKAKTKTTIMGNESDGSSLAIMQGLDHFRQEFEGEFNGNKFKAVTVLNDDKGVRKFGDNRQELDKDAVIGQKRVVYLTIIPITILPLKGKDFKTEMIAEEKVNDKPAVGIKVTGPENKDFTLYFDKESGLPVRMTAKISGFQGEEVTQEVTFSEYKEMAGIKKATRVVSKRNGEKFQEQEVTEFKLLDKVDPKTFTDVE